MRKVNTIADRNTRNRAVRSGGGMLTAIATPPGLVYLGAGIAGLRLRIQLRTNAARWC
jgi:hypothetical protein